MKFCAFLKVDGYTLKFYSDSVDIKLVSNHPRMIPEQWFSICVNRLESDREAIARIVVDKLEYLNITHVNYL